MSADRARDFLSRIEVSNVGAETLDQLADDVRRLVIAIQQQPLPRSSVIWRTPRSVHSSCWKATSGWNKAAICT